MESKRHPDPSRKARPEPGASRLYALLVGGALCLIGVVGFFYDASFDSGSSLASDYLAGTLLVNGWRNVLYLLTGFLAIALAMRAPRAAAFALGGFYLLLGIWGLIETERGIGDIAGLLPLGDRDNVFHLILGALGIGAGLMDTPRPAVKLPKRRAKPRKNRSATAKRPGKKPSPDGEPKENEKAKPQRAKPAAEKTKPAGATRGERGARERSRAARRPSDDA